LTENTVCKQNTERLVSFSHRFACCGSVAGDNHQLMAHYKGAASEAGRALQLQKKREKAVEELEHKKRKIEEELKLSTIGSKFATHYDAIEQQIRSSTVGLVTLDQMRAKQEVAVKEREKQLALKIESIQQKEAEDKRQLKERQKRQVLRSTDHRLTRGLTHECCVVSTDSDAFVPFR
jgi:hypothetical protein